MFIKIKWNYEKKEYTQWYMCINSMYRWDLSVSEYEQPLSSLIGDKKASAGANRFNRILGNYSYRQRQQIIFKTHNLHRIIVNRTNRPMTTVIVHAKPYSGAVCFPIHIDHVNSPPISSSNSANDQKHCFIHTQSLLDAVQNWHLPCSIVITRSILLLSLSGFSIWVLVTGWIW